MKNPDIKLSILMMTFNQGKFIEEAIRSVLDQEFNFKWELLIGDDASKDNTEEVVAKFLKNKKIKYYRHENNVGLHQNYVFLISKCQGKYVALLEGDDYWIDKEKCKRQVEFMESNPDLAWCCTDGVLIDENGVISKEVQRKVPKTFDLKYFLENFFNPLNNTVVFRRSAEPAKYPDFFFKVRQWDTVLHYLRAIEGEIGHLPINGLAWRRHKGAVSFSDDFVGPKRYMDWLIINRNMKKIVPPEQKKYFKNDYIAYEYIAIAFLKKRNFFPFLYYSLKMLSCKPIRNAQEYKDFFWKIRNS